MRLLHVARASAERGIRRGGLRGGQITLAAPGGESTVIERGVFAMPVLADFWTTFQWLREQRRIHDERMVAIYFRVADDEIVHVGRYSSAHIATGATAAGTWVRKNPAGAQIVVPRSIPARDILAIRRVKQLVGWTEVPEASKKWGCVCGACLGSGDRRLMRRVRGAFAVGIAAARSARADDEILSALGSLEMPLERARGRIEPKKLLAYARSPSPRVRRAVAQLLGYFNMGDVEKALARLLVDADGEVRHEAVEALLRAGGVKPTATLVARRPEDVIEHFIGLLGYERFSGASVDALERFAEHTSATVREAVRQAASAMSAEFDGPIGQKKRLAGLVPAERSPGARRLHTR